MIRSLLYVPASSPKFIAKAHERGADAVILDLEDAVAPADKVLARAALAEAVPSVGRNGAKVFVRLNAEPELQRADAEAAVRAGAFGLYLAKARDPEAIKQLADFIAPIEAEMGRGETQFVALIEDPGAVLDARPIARAPRILALTSGGEDIATAMGAEPTPEVLRLPKLLIHYAAKAEGKLSFGMLRAITDYTDLEGIAASAKEARSFGFDGSSCVHPSAVALLNAGFGASADELAWAGRVVAAADETEAGAFTVDGKMVDAPIVARARAILARG